MAAKGIELAVAYISLVPETSQIDEGLKKALKGTAKYGDTAGQDLGRRMAAQLSNEVGRGGREAGEDFSSNFRRETNTMGRQTADAISRDLVQGSAGAGRTAGRRYANEFESAADNVKVDVQGVSRGAGAEAGDSFMSGFGGGIAALGTRAGPIAGGIIAGGLAGIKVLGPQIRAALDAELSRDVVQARLNVDDAAMARIGEASGKAFVGNFGESIAANMDTATAAIQSGLLNVGSDSRSIQGVIEQLTTVSTLLGEDIPSVARSAGQVVRTGMAKDATEALDLLTVATQDGLNVSGDLLDTFTEYSTQFRKLGLDASDALGLISQAVKNGARDTDVAADALKEFSIRAVDGSEATTEAFTTLGLNADDMAAKFAAGSGTARDALDQVFDRLRNIKDPVLQSQTAVQLFGTQAEDLGAALNKFDLSTVVQEFGKVEGASQRAADTMSSNVAGEWTTARNTLLNYAAELREAWNVDQWFGTIPKAINDFFGPDQAAASGLPASQALGPTLTPNTPTTRGSMSGGPLDVFAPTGAAAVGDSGGVLTPTAQGIEQWAHGMGFTDTGGYRPKVRPEDEHHTGQAVDVMVPSIAAGNALLPNALRRPGVRYVIWNSKMWYPDGTTKPYTGPSPHTDHLHIRTGMATGGGVSGPGGPTSDSIPAWLSNGEHVLTAKEVALMGGQQGVYAFRDALHRKGGGIVDWSMANPNYGWRRDNFDPFGPQQEPWHWSDRPNGIPSQGFGPSTGGWQVVGPGGIGGSAGAGPSQSVDPRLPNFDGAAFKKALHRNTGGAISWMDFIKQADVGYKPPKLPPKPGSGGRVPHPNAGGKNRNQIASPRQGWGTPGTEWGPPPDDWWLRPVDPDDILLPDWWNPGVEGIWKHPYEKRIKPLGFNQGGAVDINQLLASLVGGELHGTAQGLPIGPVMGGDGAALDQNALTRTEGYVPAAAGFTGKTGGGIAGSLINLGSEAIQGVIQSAADLGKMAASAAAAAGSFGAGAAAGPAAGAGIQVGADIAKRGVQWGADMLNIGIGGLTEILSPFGAPRWLSDVDPTAFMPQWGVQPAATTSGEQAAQDVYAKQHGLVPAGSMFQPTPGMQQIGKATGPLPGPAQPGTIESHRTAPQPATQQSQTQPFDFLSIIKGGIFDSGGILEPGTAALNLSNRPEYVFNHAQMAEMATIAENNTGDGGGSGAVYHVYAQDLQEALRELKKQERRNSRQYSGRP